MPPLQTRRRVEFRDTDAAGIVHFSAFFFWMESAEHELLRAAGVTVARGRIVAVRCLMHQGRKPEPVAVPAEITARLAAYGADA